MEELHHKIKDKVRNAAASASKRWNGLLDADDIEQELWLFIAETPSAQVYLSDSGNNQVRRALRQRADVICSKERIDYDKFSGNWHYSPAEVRTLLKDVFAEQDIPSEEFIDLQTGMEQLRDKHPEYHETVIRVFFQEDRDVPAMKKSRAVDKLTALMNRTRTTRAVERTEGPGTKPKIAEAQY